MGTSFTNIFDQFSMICDDYRLITLFQTSPENFTTHLTGWLKPSVEDFRSVCDQDLSYDLITKSFINILNEKNIVTLSQIMKKYWMYRVVDDISQMSLHIQGDFKTYSEAQGFKTKQDRLLDLREDIDIILNKYNYAKQSSWDILFAING